MKLTWWDKLCAVVYTLYLVCCYGIKGAEEITDDDYKKAVELKKRLLEKLHEKILF